METEQRLLDMPGAKTKSALRQGVVFFRLCPREVTYFCFSLCNSFLSETRKNLAQSMKVSAIEGALVEAFTDRFPRFAAVHQRTQVSFSIRS